VIGLSTLIEFIVVLCEIYLVVWVIAFFLGLFNAAWRSPIYPLGPTLPGSIGSFIVALAVVIVFGHYRFGP
jgi:hypothetical protein